MKQTLFNLEHKCDYTSDDYIVSLSNIEAYKAIHSEVAWLNNILLIIGEESSGKTHLARIWQEKCNAKFLDENEDFPPLANKFANYILEDIEQIKSEEYLFHLINFVRNNSFSLLLTARSLPTFLIPDLRSRINAIQKIIIKKPDDEIIRVLLLKQFSDRQLKINPEVIDYIVTRAERSYSFIAKLVSLIDRLSLAEKKNITIPVVKKALSDEMLYEKEELV